MNLPLRSSPAGAVPAYPMAVSRAQIEATIERLIDLLDFLDPDPDAEPSEDAESSLGGLAVRLASGALVDDCEVA